MSRVLVLVEGQTEETFIRNILSPHLALKGVYLSAKLATTKRVKSGPDFKGGIVSYGKVKHDIERLLQDSDAKLVTTMIDYYGFSSKFPYKNKIRGGSCFERVLSLEQLFKEDINNPRFSPYLQLHEFEAMVFVSPREAANTLTEAKKEAQIFNIKNMFKSPEEINDNPDTTPSKRLSEIFPTYRKSHHGPLITGRIGLPEIREQCKHFSRWVTQLEQI